MRCPSGSHLPQLCHSRVSRTKGDGRITNVGYSPVLMDAHSQAKRGYITTTRLLLCGILAVLVSGLFRTPGSWSDVHSQWFPSLVRAASSLVLFLTTHWIYLRSKPEAIALYLLFGAMFTVSLCSLVNAQWWLERYQRPGPFDYLRHPSQFFPLRGDTSNSKAPPN